MVTFVKTTHIAEKIIFVDGLWGSGKSIIGPVLGSFKGVEKQRAEHLFEYLCTMNHFKKIECDAAITLVKLYADILLYNSMISREVNLRVNDDTGLLNNPRCITYLLRLFCKDGDTVVERIGKEQSLLQIMTHQVLPVINLAYAAFGDNLRVVEMVRHPLYMINHWYSYIDRCGNDPREFTLWIHYKGKAIPWFAYGWEEKYLSLDTIDKVVNSIKYLLDQGNNAYLNLNKTQQRQVFFIPFEKFVIDPWFWIRKLEVFLGTSSTCQTKKALKRQGCPRKCLSAGRGHKKYGWKKPSGGIDDSTDYKRRRDFVVNNASKEAIELLDKLSVQYEQEYDITF